MMRTCAGLVVVLATAMDVSAAERPSLFDYLLGSPTPTMIAYTPSQLDPRNPGNQVRLTTSSMQADLEALRPAFDGLVLYGYSEASTPRTLSIAHDLGYRAVILAIWEIKSTAELDGVAALAEQWGNKLAIGIIVGNEGLTFGRYEEADLQIAEQRLRFRLGQRFPLTTSEPLVGYQRPVVREFGEFLMPNIHPVFDRSDFSAEQGAAWAREEAAKLVQSCKKPVVLKETGFPHAGKPAYNRDTQRAFWDAYTKPGLVEKFDGHFAYHGVAFEAFDLPWKSEESKLEIEKSWGLMSPKREPYPAFEVWKGLAGRK